MSACPSENTLVGYASGRLGGVRVEDVDEHVDGCASCLRQVSRVLRTMSSDGDSLGQPVVEPEQGIPAQIEEYALLRQIGQGAMGRVFLAVDTQLDRQVAIKLLAVETRETARERFLVEARALARVSHPNVVTIYRVGQVAQRPYLVYEFVRGRSLDFIHKPLPWPRALEVAIALARGLEAAHRGGVLHRDIKPANAMLGDDGSVKLLDFGLAKLAESDGDEPVDERPAAAAVTASPALTRTGVLLGTPRYMAPEAWLGQAPTVRMDLYSLGAVIYELCTGVPLHAGDTAESIRVSTMTGAAALAQLVPGIDPGFAAAVDRCLAPTPEGRPASAEELCASLEAARLPAPVVSTPRPRRGRGLAVAAALLAVIAALVAVSATRKGSVTAPLSRAAAPPRNCSADHWCWDPRRPLHTPGVWAHARDDAWTVGYRGTIRHWDGRAWNPVESGTVANLAAVHGSAADDVWAVGDWGIALHWDGVRWRGVETPTRSQIADVLPLARDNAWAVGRDGLVMHWDGQVWTALPSGIVGDLLKLGAGGPNDVWAVGRKGAMVHWDGRRWSEIDSQTQLKLTDVAVVAPQDVWVVGYNGFVRRLVRGHWQDVELPLTVAEREDFWISAMWAVAPDDIWLMAKREPLLHWDGHAWKKYDPGTRWELYGLFGTASDDIWAASATNIMAHWDGHAWAPPQPTPMDLEYRAVWAAAADDVWTVGYAAVPGGWDRPWRALVERYDGSAWHRLETSSELHALAAVWGASKDDVWMAGEVGTLLHWDGRRLDPVASHTDANLSGLSGSRSDDVWAVGAGGETLHWNGTAWRRVPSGSTALLRAVWAGPGEAWAVGERGTTLHWDGAAWHSVPSGTSVELRGVWGSGPDDVWAVGHDGTVIRWNGQSWSPTFSDTSEHLLAISGTAADDIWAVTYMFESYHSTIVHWNGKFWTAVDRTPPMILQGIWSLGRDDVWAAGNDGNLVHYEPLAR